ncbi:MAG: PEP-CTERM sorting domain-containing protein [Blastocatellia bacterium]
MVSMICCVIAGSVHADSVTYQQLQQTQSGAATTPNASRPKDQAQQNNQGQGQSASLPPSDSASGAAKESPDRPEFVRLPDGRIVRYGPGVLCDQNCVSPVTPAAFRGPSPMVWWIATPAATAGILCAFLCGGDNDAQPLTAILIPDPTPSQSPRTQPTPPPNEIPEPGTLVLLGLGIGAMVARRRMAARKAKD